MISDIIPDAQTYLANERREGIVHQRKSQGHSRMHPHDAHRLKIPEEIERKSSEQDKTQQHSLWKVAKKCNESHKKIII